MAGENWTFWLNMTNFALGIITLLALLVVFGAVGWDLLVRKVHTAREHGTLEQLTMTPVKPLDAGHWRQRYFHLYAPPDEALRRELVKLIPKVRTKVGSIRWSRAERHAR